MRFREGAAYPFLFAEDDPNEEKTKARIDMEVGALKGCYKPLASLAYGLPRWRDAKLAIDASLVFRCAEAGIPGG